VKKKILVVEDDRQAAMVLQARLNAAGYETYIAYNGEEGWHLVRAIAPDMVILDVEMPVINGYGVCQLIKATPETKNIPVLMLTSRDTVGDIDTGFDSGADSFLAKPYSWERLQSKITKLLPEPEI
jgi:DNA-binding response OmpR family regulator